MNRKTLFTALLALLLAAASLIVGCGDNSTPAPTFELDSTIVPPVESLPSLDGTEPRPVASIEDAEGRRAEFIGNELWLSTHDEAEVDALLGRWNGEILLSFDPVEAGLEHSGLPAQYLVRIDTNLTDVTALGDDVKRVDGDATGVHRVSSAQGLGLLAAMALEAAAGAHVGVNWFGSGADYLSQSTTEAPDGDAVGRGSYDPNAFSWSTHAVETRQNTGVAEAWRVLALAGKLENRVGLAILDGGFFPDEDFANDWDAFSNIPFRSATGSKNLMKCSGRDCDYHGTNVASAAMALPDNDYGSAGPGGPVAKPIFVSTFGDMFTSITAIAEARAHGAKIVNMSYGVPVPSALGFTVLPFESATGAFHSSGMLLFAAAGNSGDNVDEDYFWGIEKTWHTPCENAGVICVGGLATDSLNRHGNSNYGNKQVDIFAPYVLGLGPDPDSPENAVQKQQGTSFSSPFVAGVAALIWAADPDLSANEVEHLLLDNTHSSPDKKVGRVVNALDAVLGAIGTASPVVTIDGLEDGDRLVLNIDFYLSARVADLEDGTPCCDVSWDSDVDGPLADGRGHFGFYHAFATPGPRTLTVTAVDSQGARTSASVTIDVVNFAPTVAISRPQAGETAFAGQEFVLRATGFDVNEPNRRLACERLVWNSNVASDPFPQLGCHVPMSFASVGTRQITVTATDPQGEAATATATLDVVAPPPNLPPTVEVISPASYRVTEPGERITLAGIASDPEGSTPLLYTWTVYWNGGNSAIVGNSAAVEWKPSDTINFNTLGDGDGITAQIQLDVRDPQGNVGSDYVFLEWIIVQ